jgi:hypothetical protein
MAGGAASNAGALTGWAGTGHLSTQKLALAAAMVASKKVTKRVCHEADVGSDMVALSLIRGLVISSVKLGLTMMGFTSQLRHC